MADWKHMVRRMLLVILSVVCAAVVHGGAASDDLPEGKGKDALLKMCANCHGVDQATSARNSKKQWTYVVDDMVSRGAEGSDDEVSAVIGYLSRNFGKPVNINSATAKEIETGLSFPTAQAELLVRYRTEKGAFQSYEDLLKVPGLDAQMLEEQKKNILF